MKALRYIAIQLILAASVANAAPTDKVKPLSVRGLEAFKDHFVSVFYVIGNKPIVSVDSRQIEVTTIKSALGPLRVGTGNSLELPEVEIPRVGFRPSYNFVLFVVHVQSQFVWSNADGTVPADPRGITPQSGNMVAAKVFSLSKSEIEKLDADQNLPAVLRVQF